MTRPRSVPDFELGTFTATSGDGHQHVEVDTTVSLGPPTIENETGDILLEFRVTVHRPNKRDQEIRFDVPEHAAHRMIDTVRETLQSGTIRR